MILSVALGIAADTPHPDDYRGRSMSGKPDRTPIPIGEGNAQKMTYEHKIGINQRYVLAKIAIARPIFFIFANL
ncbi:MAG: hypothetical protein AAF934_12705 [Bacteroidota bacterium]